MKGRGLSWLRFLVLQGGRNDKITRIGQVALRATALSARLSRIILLPQV